MVKVRCIRPADWVSWMNYNEIYEAIESSSGYGDFYDILRPEGTSTGWCQTRFKIVEEPVRKEMICVNDKGAPHGIEVGKKYLIEPFDERFCKAYGHGLNGTLCFPDRFKEIEVKTPPGPCKCKPPIRGNTYYPTGPEDVANQEALKRQMTNTGWQIVRKNLMELGGQLKLSNATERETELILETCLFILKGK